MVSIELLRQYPFFAGFDYDQLKVLAMAAAEHDVSEGHIFFNEDETLSNFYLLLEGTVALMLKIPDREVIQARNNHITGDFITRDIHMETLEAGELFGWSALIAPYQPTASAKAIKPSRVVSFNTESILQKMEDESAFGQAMTLKMAQIIRERLRGQRMELLAEQI